GVPVVLGPQPLFYVGVFPRYELDKQPLARKTGKARDDLFKIEMCLENQMMNESQSDRHVRLEAVVNRRIAAAVYAPCRSRIHQITYQCTNREISMQRIIVEISNSRFIAVECCDTN